MGFVIRSVAPLWGVGLIFTGDKPPYTTVTSNIYFALNYKRPTLLHPFLPDIGPDLAGGEGIEVPQTGS